MGMFCRLSLLITVIIFAVAYHKFRNLTKPLEVPYLDVDYYWGPGDKTAYNEDKVIYKRQVQYDEAVIKDLENKLSEPLSLHPPLEGVQHEYGINSNTLVEFVNYWKTEYMPKWSDRLELINAVPHYQTQIQG